MARYRTNSSAYEKAAPPASANADCLSFDRMNPACESEGSSLSQYGKPMRSRQGNGDTVVVSLIRTQGVPVRVQRCAVVVRLDRAVVVGGRTGRSVFCKETSPMLENIALPLAASR